jgi:transcriptional regulator with XRE-family HTH domain
MKIVKKHRWLTALKESRIAASYTLDGAASELNMSCSALSRIESGERSLELHVFEKLCEMYCVTPESVFDGKPIAGEFHPLGMDPGERMRMLRKSAGLTLNALAQKMGAAQSTLSLVETSQRRLTMRFLERFLLFVHKPASAFFRGLDEPHMIQRQIIGAAAAGRAGTAEIGGAGPDTDTVLAPELKYRNLFPLEIDGDSMYPYYNQGDVVYCTDEIEAQNGEIAVVRFTDGSTVCKVISRKADGLVLRSINPEWEDKKVPFSEVECVWPVVGSFRRERGRKV